MTFNTNSLYFTLFRYLCHSFKKNTDLDRLFKNRYILFACLFFMGFSLNAQEKEFGVFVGGSNYFGDLNPSYSFKETRPATSIFYRYNFNPRMSFRAAMGYYWVTASDNKQKKYPYLLARNLNFSNQIIEVSGTYELNFFKFNPLKEKDRFSPYIFVGASIFYFQPTTKFNGKKYRLQEIGTEGQKGYDEEVDNGYNTFSLAIPFGGGIKWAINKKLSLNVEFNSRKTFTDWLDDVSGNYPDPESLFLVDENGSIASILSDRSPETGIDPIAVNGKQRGTSKDKDRFNFFGIGLTYTIFNPKCPRPY